MIATWMLYAIAVGGLVTVAASAIDRVATTRGRPVRFVWLAAIIATVAWPIGHAIQLTLPKSAAPVTLMPFTITLPAVVASGESGLDRAQLIDRGLVALWVGLSVLFALRLVHGIVTLRRTQRGWRVSDVDGTRVRLSDNVGPAVVGLSPMDVVLPEWIMALDPHLRAMVLRHEEEHRTARDPYLLCAAGVAAALMPWNPALWLQARRLRLAIEMDCDGRVLRAHPSPERYGMLMLTIAQRRSVTPAMFAPMLSEPTTQLERRIIAMRTTTRRLARVTMYGGVTIAAAAIFVACALQADNPTGPSPSPLASRSPARSTPDQTYFDFQVEQVVTPSPGNTGPRYPDILRSAQVEGEVLVQFAVDTLGHADMSTFKPLKSTHDLFTATVRASLPTMRFNPAQVGGRPVRQLVQVPFQFSLTKTPEAREASLQAQLANRVRIQAIGTARSSQVDSTRYMQLRLNLDSTARHEPDRVSIDLSANHAAAATSGNANSEYREFRISKPVAPMPNNVPPRFPQPLREAGVEGSVLAQFVVNADGTVDMSTFRVLKSTHDLFTNAVKQALPAMQFSPAEADGRPVRQLMQMPFEFSLTK